ncbi:MAG: acyltransferase [Lachnospiraceae bacterium]|nr:acyltransferase [Lachnospiraceae bacterium]
MAKEKYYKSYANYNVGISMLKMIMCFSVIVAHLWKVNTTNSGVLGWIYYLREYAVPVFMILAFYFSEKFLSDLSGEKLLNRIIRLVVPLWSWAVIYWVVYKLLQETLYPGFNLQIQDLLWQMTTGNSVYLNGAMWFQVDLILLTLLFALIIFVAQKFKNHVFVLLTVGCLYIQYTGITLFMYKWKAELSGTCGRFFEMLPMAVAGYMLANYGLLNKAKKNWITTIIVCLAGLKLVRYYDVISKLNFEGLDPGKQAFDYAGLNRVTVALLMIFLCFVLPLDKLPRALKVIIEWLTKYTLGIYCSHMLVARLLDYFLTHKSGVGLETDTIGECIATYIICYFICFLIARVPCKWTKMLVE